MLQVWQLFSLWSTNYIDLCVGRTWKKSSYCEHYFKLFALLHYEECARRTFKLRMQVQCKQRCLYIYIFVLL